MIQEAEAALKTKAKVIIFKLDEQGHYIYEFKVTLKDFVFHVLSYEVLAQTANSVGMFIFFGWNR